MGPRDVPAEAPDLREVWFECIQPHHSLTELLAGAPDIFSHHRVHKITSRGVRQASARVLSVTSRVVFLLEIVSGKAPTARVKRVLPVSNLQCIRIKAVPRRGGNDGPKPHQIAFVMSRNCDEPDLHVELAHDPCNNPRDMDARAICDLVRWLRWRLDAVDVGVRVFEDGEDVALHLRKKWRKGVSPDPKRALEAWHSNNPRALMWHHPAEQRVGPPQVEIEIEKGPAGSVGVQVDQGRKLHSITPGSPSDREGMSAMVGRTLTHIDGAPVTSVAHIAVLTKGKTRALLGFDCPPPPSPLPSPPPLPVPEAVEEEFEAATEPRSSAPRASWPHVGDREMWSQPVWPDRPPPVDWLPASSSFTPVPPQSEPQVAAAPEPAQRWSAPERWVYQPPPPPPPPPPISACSDCAVQHPDPADVAEGLGPARLAPPSPDVPSVPENRRRVVLQLSVSVAPDRRGRSRSRSNPQPSWAAAASHHRPLSHRSIAL
eukprot:TRINITY_DN13217_c0_g1_i1.p1 TRINITY_DN13217_c0_g1~~TRINITY_DN13217_c0_g1_i1.p1  ORF type:complete len:487 (+),score=109.78 TRINITY_DN13217_c0_g1_i1:99-1559(+)